MTDDNTDRRTLARMINGFHPDDLFGPTAVDWHDWALSLEKADAIIAAGFRRHPEAIRDEKVEAAMREYKRITGEMPSAIPMRAALIAASQVSPVIPDTKEEDQ